MITIIMYTTAKCAEKMVNNDVGNALGNYMKRKLVKLCSDYNEGEINVVVDGLGNNITYSILNENENCDTSSQNDG